MIEFNIMNQNSKFNLTKQQKMRCKNEICSTDKRQE